MSKRMGSLIAMTTAMANRAADDLACAMYLGFRFAFTDTWAPLLAELLEQGWHKSHEDIASALQDIRDPSSVGALFRTANKRLSYLEFDEAFALAVKCIWALHDIGTDEAVAGLQQLLLSDVPRIREAARERLLDLAATRPGDPTPDYRIARDARVRRTKP